MIQNRVILLCNSLSSTEVEERAGERRLPHFEREGDTSEVRDRSTLNARARQPIQNRQSKIENLAPLRGDQDQE